MALTLEQFWEAVDTVGLLSAADVEALKLEAGSTTPTDELARKLVERGKLTRYQAAAVYQGKAQTLSVGNYLILDKLGAGGMGQVFRARHRKMDRIVALKVLPRRSVASPDAVERFQREAKAAARLAHPNIVTAHDADEAGGTHFLVMEYVEGTDLSSLVKAQGPLPVPQAVSCVLQAARGLQHAHAEGVIHRDIKPSNLLLDKRGKVKILDMGLARISGGDQPGTTSDTSRQSELTQSGSVMGTIDYMAPEQALDTHRADARADIYSLGCVLFYLLTGRPPYSGDTLMTRLVAHRESPIPSLCEARPEVPPALDQVFQRMLAKTLADRFQSIDEVISALEAVVHGAAAAQPPRAAVQPTPPTAAKTKSGTKSRRPVVFAGVAAALLVAGVGVWWVSRPQPVEIAQLEPPVEQVAGHEVPAKPATASAPPAAPAAAMDSQPSAPAVASPPAPARLPPAAPLNDSMLPAGPPAADPVSPPATPAVPSAPAASQAETPPMPASPDPVVAAAAADSNSQPADPPAAAAPELRPIPDSAAQEAALKVIKQIFESDYAAAKNAEGKTELAQKLFAQADATSDDPAARYVLLLEARNLGADVSDTAMIDRAIKALGASYKVDVWEMTADVYQRLASKSRPAAANKALAENVLSLAGQAIEADQLDIAEKLFKVAAVVAGKARDATLVKQAKAEADKLAAVRREIEMMQKARAALAKDPADSQANLALGRYLCESEDNWAEGVAHLAKGSDAALAELAKTSLPVPADAGALAALGDAWWDAAEKRKGKESDFLRAGARHWYAAALPQLTGIVHTKVEKRLEESQATVGDRVVRRNSARQSAGQLPQEMSIPLGSGVGMAFRLIPAGSFTMGRPGDTGSMRPHQVSISKAFYLGTIEVTQAQWLAVMGNQLNGNSATPQSPLTGVTWNDCQQFLAKLNQHPAGRDLSFELPTEAEWEYACRAGTTTAYSFGDDPNLLPQYGWFVENSSRTWHEAGQLRPNPWGLFDMHGNVWEWCQDWWSPTYYNQAPSSDPPGPTSGARRALRGGGAQNKADACRSDERNSFEPNAALSQYGFRVAARLKQPLPAASPRSRQPQSTVGNVNLLRLIKLPRDVVYGDAWAFENGKLIAGNSDVRPTTARLILPTPVPAEYALHLTVSRRTGFSLYVGLLVGGRQCGAYFQRESTGLGMVDGKGPANNPTSSASVWNDPGPRDIVCRVNPGGVAVEVDGKPIYRWQGDPQSLSVFPSWVVPNSQAIWIGAVGGTFEISRLELVPPSQKPVAADK